MDDHLGSKSLVDNIILQTFLALLKGFHISNIDFDFNYHNQLRNTSKWWYLSQQMKKLKRLLRQEY